MREQPMLGDLRTVDDETLYRRLLQHQRMVPPKDPALTYGYRMDLWEMVTKALRAEIARRKAPAPPWWPENVPKPVDTRRRNLIIGIVVYACLLVLTAVFAFMSARETP